MGSQYISGFLVTVSVATLIGFSSSFAWGFDPTEQTSLEEQQDIHEVETVHMAAVPAPADDSENEQTPLIDPDAGVPVTPEEPPE